MQSCIPEHRSNKILIHKRDQPAFSTLMRKSITTAWQFTHLNHTHAIYLQNSTRRNLFAAMTSSKLSLVRTITPSSSLISAANATATTQKITAANFILPPTLYECRGKEILAVRFGSTWQRAGTHCACGYIQRINACCSLIGGNAVTWYQHLSGTCCHPYQPTHATTHHKCHQHCCRPSWLDKGVIICCIAKDKAKNNKKNWRVWKGVLP